MKKQSRRLPIDRPNDTAKPGVKESDFNQSSTVGLATMLNVHGLDAVCSNSMFNQDSMIHDETYRREIPNPPLLAQTATKNDLSTAEPRAKIYL